MRSLDQVVLDNIYFFFQAEDGIRDLIVTGVQTCALPISYFGVFEYKDSQYAFSMPGVIYKKISKKFTPVNNIFDYDVRHSGVLVQDDFLYIFYSRVGDKPESILMSYVDMTKPSVMWKASEPVMVLKPEMDWEGANLPLIQS